MSFHVVIPARHASTRLPGKPLLDIGGLPMVVRVAERARAAGASEIVIATDHADIAAAAARHGHAAEMTDAGHASGTDRIAEVAQRRGWKDGAIVVNVQGDEPLMDPGLIGAVAALLAARPAAAIATAACAITERAELNNPNVVKVVTDAEGYALYFSRAPIPWARDARADDAPQARRHIGIYAYRGAFLKTYARLAPAPLERIESLEQLRALWHGHRIAVADARDAPHAGVDTPEDLARVRKLFENSAR